jgi:hypothetical protein
MIQSDGLDSLVALGESRLASLHKADTSVHKPVNERDGRKIGAKGRGKGPRCLEDVARPQRTKQKGGASAADLTYIVRTPVERDWLTRLTVVMGTQPLCS